MISQEYKKILNDIHGSTPFGKRGKIPKDLARFIDEIRPTTILDYGCGKGRLVSKLQEVYPKKTISGYDPGNSQFNNNVKDVQVDLLMSTDVLEHVEPEHIDETLKFLSTKSRYVYHLIACCPAKLILPDGRNAHLIIEDAAWWREKFLNLNYKIIKESYNEFQKTPKGQTKPLVIKKYVIMAEKL